MTNHPNRSAYRYFRVCPRGFANEIIYYRAKPDQVAAVESYYRGWQDRQFDQGNTSATCGWTQDSAARHPGVAIDWEDRDWGHAAWLDRLDKTGSTLL